MSVTRKIEITITNRYSTGLVSQTYEHIVGNNEKLNDELSITEMSKEDSDALFEMLLPLLLKRDGATIAPSNGCGYRLRCYHYDSAGPER